MKNSPIFKEPTWNPKSGLSLTELAYPAIQPTTNKNTVNLFIDVG